MKEKQCCESSKKNNPKQEKECCARNKEKASCCANNEREVDSCGKCNIKQSKSSLKKQIIFLCISLVCLILSLIDFWHLIGCGSLHSFDFGYIAIVLCGYPIFISAFNNIKNKKISSSVLVSIAIIASVVLEILSLSGIGNEGGHGHGYILAAGEIAFLMSLGGLIEAWTVSRSRKGIEKLINMSPQKANIKSGDEIISVNISEVKIGDIVVVKPNEMLPVDGKIIAGSTSVDESSITGEFLPCDKNIGDIVYAATWNKMGMIEIEVTKSPEDMTVSKLINLVSEAEGKKAPISRLADRWAGLIVPIALVLSVVVAVITYFAFDISFVEALVRGTTILVVFCPCALTLATPTAVAAGIGNGSFNGIIIKSGDAIERLSGVNTVAFDKTGTITSGELTVVNVITFNIETNILLKFMGSAEKYSEHPIGKAIYKYVKDKIDIPEPTNTESLVGVGIKAVTEGQNIEIVSYKTAEQKFKNNKNLQELKKYLNEGCTIAVCVLNKKLLGAIALSDTVKKGTADAINQINVKGYSTLMLTGDNQYAAQNIAEKCGISNFKAGLLPEDKLTAIQNLKEQNKIVCMVGDGVNDAPALASADCSIAMGALGSDAAIEAADVAVMNNDIQSVSNTLQLSKTVMRKIKINIAFSMTVNFLAVIFSTLGWLTPVTGAIVHNVSSVFVVLNSAMILRKKYKTKQL